MHTPILKTKLFIPPPPPQVVPRFRLFEKLDSGTNRKLTLISAPAGFGKTTLLSSYLHHRRPKATWISLDEHDNDPIQFLTYLTAALQTTSPNLGKDVLLNLKSMQVSESAVLNLLINDITENLESKTILVIDDYHLIESQDVDKALYYFLEHMPSLIHLVIGSRTDPAFPLARLRSHGLLADIRIKDLRFTKEEAVEFLISNMKLSISREDAAALETRTEGWAAGLQMAAISIERLNNRQEITRFIDQFSSSHHFVLDYLTDEVLEQRPAGTKDFLLQTSILNQLYAPLCQAVTSMDNCQEILESLEAANLFLVPLDDERCWYRYHQLFKDLLQKRLETAYPEIVAMLHLKAARWYQQHGRIMEALEHLISAERYSEAADLVESNAKGLLEKSELATLITWVDRLPENTVQDRPWLNVYYAWALRLTGKPFNIVQTSIDKAKTGISKIEGSQIDNLPTGISIDTNGQFNKLLGHILALESFQHLYKEEIPSVLKLTQEAQNYHIEEKFVLAAVAFARGWALRFSGDLEVAQFSFADCVEYSLASQNIFLAVSASCRAAYGTVLGGKLRQAEKEFQDAVALATTQDGTIYPVAGYADVYLGGIYYEWNDLEPAERYLSEGIKRCEQVGYLMDQVVGLVNLALLYRASGDWEMVNQNISQAEKLSEKMKSYVYVRRWVENVQVRIWASQKQWDHINRWIQSCGMKVGDELDFTRDLDHVILARALYYSSFNQPGSSSSKDALQLLIRLRNKALSRNWFGKSIEILVLLTLVCHQMDDIQSAYSHLEQALKLAESEGYLRIFLDEGEDMYKILVEYQKRIGERNAWERDPTQVYVNRILAEYAQDQAERFPEFEEVETSRNTDELIEILSAREIQVLSLMSEGLTNQEIAGELCIAVTTAKKHVSNIIGKLEVTNRTQAVARARELDLL